MPPLYNENTGCVTIVTQIENSITGRARGNGPPPSGNGRGCRWRGLTRLSSWGSLPSQTDALTRSFFQASDPHDRW
jgi:hypothetical protein